MNLADSIAAVAAEDLQLQADLVDLNTNVDNVQAELNQQGQTISDLQAQVAGLIAQGDGASTAQLEALSTIATDLGAAHQRLSETNALLASALPKPTVPPAVDPPATEAPVGGTDGPVNPEAGAPSDTSAAPVPSSAFVAKLAGETYNEYVDRAAAAGFTSVLDEPDWNALEVGAPVPEPVVPTAESGA